MSEDLPKPDKPPRGEIKLSWLSAIAEAWEHRKLRHIMQSVIVSSIAGISIALQNGIADGLFRWALLAVAILAITVGDDARLLRKASRDPYWTPPASLGGRND